MPVVDIPANNTGTTYSLLAGQAIPMTSPTGPVLYWRSPRAGTLSDLNFYLYYPISSGGEMMVSVTIYKATGISAGNGAQSNTTPSFVSTDLTATFTSAQGSNYTYYLQNLEDVVSIAQGDLVLFELTFTSKITPPSSITLNTVNIGAGMTFS
ncbi:MAG: hypothetical protein ACYCQJ_13905 [Nitrososphaerales archaeon]